MTDTTTTTTIDDNELKLLIKLFGDLATLVSEATSGFSLSEIGQVLSILSDIKTTIAGITTALPEIKSLDDASRADLIAYVSENVKYPANANVEEVMQKVLNLIISSTEILQLFKI